jgi:hypothetical protein
MMLNSYVDAVSGGCRCEFLGGVSVHRYTYEDQSDSKTSLQFLSTLEEMIVMLLSRRN